MEGVRVAWINDSSRVNGILRPMALRFGILVGLCYLVAFGLYSSIWLGPAAAFALGLTVLPVGAMVNKALNKLLRLLFS
jgi:hypothetical protein